jgi:hypothetical protein
VISWCQAFAFKCNVYRLRRGESRVPRAHEGVPPRRVYRRRRRGGDVAPHRGGVSRRRGGERWRGGGVVRRNRMGRRLGRVGTFHTAPLFCRHETHASDDSRQGPRDQSDTRECQPYASEVFPWAREDADPFQQPEGPADAVFVNEFNCRGKGACPSYCCCVERSPGWGCASRMQATNSLQAPSFNP